ncbi:MAG: MBL fold metallo-hydrolase [Spirochaetes bacterium]|nr:MBL fold metallo-hydrolase [Spirochaetota bacterium]
MKIYTALNPESLSNIYLIISDNKNYGVLIDPGSFSQNVYQMIKNTSVDIKKIIITHNGPEQINGIPLIKKIFNADIYAYDEIILDYETITVRNDSLIDMEEMNFKIIETPVHTYDSISILTNDAIFIGDIFQAGSLSSFIEKKEPSKYEFNIIKNKILSLTDNIIIYPGQGPATTLEIERKFNPYFINL